MAAAAAIVLAGLTPARAADPYDIYAIVSQTGPFAFLGNNEAQSLRMVEQLANKQGGINGQPLRITIEDDGSNPATAVQLANGVIAKGAQVLMGPTYLASCLAIAPLVKAGGPLQYCFAPTIHPPPGAFTFSAGASSGDQAYESLVFMQAKGWKRIAFIETSDATGQDIDGRFMDAYNTGHFSKLTFIDKEHFSTGDVTIAAQVAKIAALKPDAIIMTCVGTSTGTALRGLKDAGLDVPVMSNLGNVIHTQINQYVDILPKDIYFTAPRYIAHDVSLAGPVRDAQTEFYKAYAALGNPYPDVGNNFSWDPAWIVIDALRHLGTTATATQLRDYIEKLHGYAGTDGIYDYRGGDQRGLGLSSLVIVKWNHATKNWNTVSEPGGKPLP